ncbi:glycosyltransferase family 4 protein [Deinococcus sp. YIM 134068]|uniref:glycosyltransferase family 4 protein n=1 Tax=Deinococcus lichenicola TaxID=3118910 RepID=UPI002F92BFA2
MNLRLMYLLTIPHSALWYLRGQLAQMQAAGYETCFVSTRGAGGELEEVGRREGVAVYPLEVSREIDLRRDLVSMWHLHWIMCRVRPQIVNFGNPKTGLVGGLVSWARRVPVRVYTLHGLRLETVTGRKRQVLWLCEWLTIRCAHRVVAVSPSLRERALELGLTSPRKIVTLHHGSVNGIRPVVAGAAEVESVRARLNLRPGGVVFGFVGRFTRDKGIRELVAAFVEVRETFPNATLLLVGDFEEGDPVDAGTQARLAGGGGILRAGYVTDVVPYYALMDVLVLPTYREGFPTVALEAASAGLPLVTTDATGARDAVREGETGLRVPVGNVEALGQAMARLAGDPGLRRRLGEEARKWVTRDFAQERLWKEWDMLYRRLWAESRERAARTRRLALGTGMAFVLTGLAARAAGTFGRRGKG